MAKQLMIYNNVTPLSSTVHGNWSVEMGKDYAFAKDVSAVPLLLAEFPAAAVEQTIVFSGDGKSVVPSLILGLSANTNAHVKEDGSWHSGYIPAFLRRYPFIFAGSEGQEKLALCMDDSFAGISKTGKGEPLFDADGKPTAFLQTQLRFNQEYQEQSKKTQAFTKALKKLGLLEPSKIDFQHAGKKASLGGFMTINREKFQALPAKALKDMMKSGDLERCFQHLQSLNNLGPMARRLSAG